MLVHFVSISGQLVYPKLAKVRACLEPGTWHPSQWQFPARPRSLAVRLKNNTAAAEVKGSHVRNFSTHRGHGKQQQTGINVSYTMIERADKGKMWSAKANRPPGRTTEVKNEDKDIWDIFLKRLSLSKKRESLWCLGGRLQGLFLWDY